MAADSATVLMKSSIVHPQNLHTITMRSPMGKIGMAVVGVSRTNGSPEARLITTVVSPIETDQPSVPDGSIDRDRQSGRWLASSQSRSLSDIFAPGHSVRRALLFLHRFYPSTMDYQAENDHTDHATKEDHWCYSWAFIVRRLRRWTQPASWLSFFGFYHLMLHPEAKCQNSRSQNSKHYEDFIGQCSSPQFTGLSAAWDPLYEVSSPLSPQPTSVDRHVLSAQHAQQRGHDRSLLHKTVP